MKHSARILVGVAGLVLPVSAWAAPILTYSDITDNGTSLSQLNAGGAVADDLFTIDPTNPIVAFTIGYFMPDESGLTDIVVNFYDNDGVNVPGGGATLLGTVECGTFGGGTNYIYIDGFGSIPIVSNAVWMEVDFSDTSAGLVVSGDPGGAVGTSNDVYAAGGASGALAGGTWSDFYLEVYQAPEPTTLVALLAVIPLIRRSRK